MLHPERVCSRHPEQLFRIFSERGAFHCASPIRCHEIVGNPAMIICKSVTQHYMYSSVTKHSKVCSLLWSRHGICLTSGASVGCPCWNVSTPSTSRAPQVCIDRAHLRVGYCNPEPMALLLQGVVRLGKKSDRFTSQAHFFIF